MAGYFTVEFDYDGRCPKAVMVGGEGERFVFRNIGPDQVVIEFALDALRQLYPVGYRLVVDEVREFRLGCKKMVNRSNWITPDKGSSLWAYVRPKMKGVVFFSDLNSATDHDGIGLVAEMLLHEATHLQDYREGFKSDDRTWEHRAVEASSYFRQAATGCSEAERLDAINKQMARYRTVA